MPSYIDVFTGNVIQPWEVSYARYDLFRVAGPTSVTLVWPFNALSGQNVCARIIDVSTDGPSSGPGAGIFSMFLPPADQVSVGQDVLFNNIGTRQFALRDADGNTIGTVLEGEQVYLYLIDNSTEAGVWRIFTFGTGTSAADAAALAGAGLIAQFGTLNLALFTVEITADPAIDEFSRAVSYLWTGGAGFINLPAAAFSTDFFFEFRNQGTGSVTFQLTSGGDTVNEAGSLVCNPGDSAFFIADGIDKWYTIGLGRSVLFAYSALTKDVSAGGVFTLSTVEAANKIITIVGAPVATVSVDVPAVPSVYNIRNDASGTQLVYVGVAGVSSFVIQLPANSNRIIVCTGTGVFEFPSFPGGAVQFDFGSAAAPSINFVGASTDGFYHPVAANTLGVTLNGIARGLWEVEGYSILGEFNEATVIKINTAQVVGLAGASALANVIPAGALVLGVSTRVTALIAGAASFDVGDGTDVDKWGAAIAVAAGTTSDGANFTVLTPTFYPAATNVVLTANGGAFAGGSVRVSIHYIDLVPAAS